MADQTSYLRELRMLTDATHPLLLVTEAIDVARLRQICAQMETIAPFVEPTAYMRGGMTVLRDQAAFLAAVERFVAEVRKLDRRPEPAVADRRPPVPPSAPVDPPPATCCQYAGLRPRCRTDLLGRCVACCSHYHQFSED